MSCHKRRYGFWALGLYSEDKYVRCATVAEGRYRTKTATP